MITRFIRYFGLPSVCLALGLLTPIEAGATIFAAQEVEQADFIAVARPYGNKYDLLIIQQIQGKRQCWSESGANPTIVDPLLLNFDFTGSCERSTDSNGYSLRLDGEDYGMNYLFRIVEREGDLLLVASDRAKPSREIVIGRTGGKSSGLLKIQLNPGWRFTKRAFAGKTLGHVYLTGESKDFNNPLPAIAQRPAGDDNTAEKGKELTFTAPTAPGNATLNSESFAAPDFNNVTPPPDLPQAGGSNLKPPDLPETGGSNLKPPAPPINSLPPLPTPENANSRIVPPPPLTGNGNRKSLSDVIARNSGGATSNRSNNFRVMVEAKNGNARNQLRSVFPDAFPTSYNGRSLWQVGVFSSRDKAQVALQSATSLGLDGIIVPF